MLNDQILTLEINILMGLGIMSGILSVIAFIPYIVDTLRQRTQPERASWLIWSVLGSIAFVSQVYEDATHSLWFAGVQVGATLLIFLLSIRYGANRYMSRQNQVIFLIAFAGLVAWYYTDTAVYALAITVSISLLGGCVTVKKAYENPETETLSTWVMALLASVCAILSVGNVDWVVLAYPMYLLVLYTAIIGAILLGQTREAAVTMPSALRREPMVHGGQLAKPPVPMVQYGFTVSDDIGRGRLTP